VWNAVRAEAHGRPNSPTDHPVDICCLLPPPLPQVRSVGPDALLLSPDTRSERTIKQVRHLQASSKVAEHLAFLSLTLTLSCTHTHTHRRMHTWQWRSCSGSPHATVCVCVGGGGVDTCAPSLLLAAAVVQVLPPAAWDTLFQEVQQRLSARPGAIRHLLVLLPVPIVYPKIPVSESLLHGVAGATAPVACRSIAQGN
jgi:hypothetical protein